ncbi:MAG: glutamate--tRNA ligase [Planctomycetota bacterium]|nr:glutamate--tRNA ligase [Planctomycetota bacterium]MDP6940447.1 glutamate--tRNA ligase [Planctomycetota bacterium]
MTELNRPVRLRFAPSPTGRLHIGGARTALFNWAYARKMGGTFILRIEDTDQERNSQESLDSILDSLRWLGLDWDEGPGAEGDYGPYFQSERSEHYASAAAKGLEEGWLYRCFCTPERIQKLKEEKLAAKENPHYDRCCRSMCREESDLKAETDESFVLRFAVPDEEPIIIQDHVRGEVRFHSSQVEDWVAVRSGGMPTYNFVCALDDAAMEISHVLRGEEHLVNTPKQILIYRAMGLPEPEFVHVPLILGQNGKKLSKRTGDTAVADYQIKGYPAEALFNFLSLLGFSIDDETTIFDSNRLIEAFDLKRINSSGAIFDTDKLAWICGDYIRSSTPSDLVEKTKPFLKDAGLLSGTESEEWLSQVAAAYQERIQLYSELPEVASWIFQELIEPDKKAAKALRADTACGVLAEISKRLEAEPHFPPSEFDGWMKAVSQELGIGMGNLMKPIRARLAGTLGGPPVGEMMALLGKEKTLTRLRAT